MAIKVIHIKPEFVDKRGFISRLVDQNKFHLRSVLYIKSKKGAVRANHYHKHDFHYVYCLSGKFKYFEKSLSLRSKLDSVILKPGDLVLTKPLTIHAMVFLKDSVFLALTSETRKQAHYEKDTKRIELVSPN